MAKIKHRADSLLPYIPFRIVHQLLDCRPEEFPLIEDLSGSVIFADVASFTPMSAAVARSGPSGNEALMNTLIRYYSDLIDEVRRFGGTVYQFAGDSVLVGFNITGGESHEDNVQRAIACAQEIVKNVKKYQNIVILDSEYHIFCKIGIGFGNYRQIILGSNNHYYRAVVFGDAVANAVSSQAHARGADLVVCDRAWDLLPEDKRGKPINESKYLLDEDYTINIDLGDRGNFPDGRSLNRISERMSRFIDPTIQSKIVYGHNSFAYDHREVTSVLLRLTSDADEKKSDQFLKELNTYYNIVLRESRIYGGVVIQVDLTDKGNVLFVLFGAPVAIDNRELMAVRFAWKMIGEANRNGRYREISNIQIGITTGSAFCGDLGAPFRKGYTVIGEDVNIATRLMMLGDSNSIHMDLRTAEKVKAEFLLREIENIQLKGIEAPRSVFFVENQIERLDGFIQQHHNEFIGRESEFQRLNQLLERTLNGEGQICSLQGEVGLGKSWLLSMFIESRKMDSIEVVPGVCYAHERYTPYFPWREILRLLFGVFEFISGDDKIDKIESEIEKLNSVDKSWIPVIAQILGIPANETEKTRRLDGKQKNNKIFEILRLLLVQRSLTRPVLLIFEDAHWIDEISLDLIKHIAGIIERFPIMIVLSHRPSNLIKNIRYLNNYNLIELQPITDERMRFYIENRYGICGGEGELIDTLVGRSDGNPFFLDMLVKTLKEKDKLQYIDDLNCWKSFPGDFEYGLPSGLQDVILNRVDMLQETDRIILKTASVIGNIFDIDTLENINPLEFSSNELIDVLSRLEAGGFIKSEGENSDKFNFSNPLIYESVYESLMVATKEDLHRCTADYLKEKYAWNLGLKSGVIAEHYMKANQNGEALNFYLMAARFATQEYDMKDAIVHYLSAIRILSEPHFNGMDELLVGVTEELAGVERQCGNYDAAITHYNSSLNKMWHPLDKARIRMGLGRTYHERGNHKLSIKQLKESLMLSGMYVPAKKWHLYPAILIEYVKHVFFESFKRTEGKKIEKEKLETLALQNEVLEYLSKVLFHDSVPLLAWAVLKNLNTAVELSSERDLAIAYSNYATFFLGIGQVERAGGYLSRAETMTEMEKDPQAIAQIFQRSGLHSLFLNNPLETINSERKEIEILKEIGEKWELLSGYMVEGFALMQISDYECAYSSFQESDRLSGELGSLMFNAMSSYWMAFAGYMMGRHNANMSRLLLRKARRLSQEAEEGLARIQGLACILPIHQNDPNNAARQAKLAYQQLNKIHIYLPVVQIVYVYAGEAALFALRNLKPDKSRKRLSRIVKKCIKKSKYYAKTMPYIKGPSLRLEADYACYRGRKSKAKKLYLKAFNTLEKTENSWELGVTYYNASKNLKDYFHEYKSKAITIFERKRIVAELRRIEMDDEP